MPKRRVTFDAQVKVVGVEEGVPGEVEEGLEVAEEEEEEEEEERKSFNKKFKHSLDSDEEDDEEQNEKYNVLNVEDIEGEEEGVPRFEGEVKVTPFNMSEELEEGHFDKEGTYIYNKEEEVKDHWLDNIDWVRIKQLPETEAGERMQGEDEDTEGGGDVDVNECYRGLLLLMASGETVQGAIQRLGKGIVRNKRKDRPGRSESDQSRIEDNESEQDKKKRETLMKLTALADRVLGTGDMGIYQKSFEQITFLLKQSESAQTSASNSNFDMFADEPEQSQGSGEAKPKIVQPPTIDQVLWEFKWENKEEAPIYGPHANDQMICWANDGYFDAGVWVRRLNQADAQFYTSKRIDFELFS